MNATKTVYEVLHDTGRDGGPAADGTAILRFSKLADAQRFADSKTCYGHPATVSSVNVSRRLASRWGL